MFQGIIDDAGLRVLFNQKWYYLLKIPYFTIFFNPKYGLQMTCHDPIPLDGVIFFKIIDYY
jgi:hypothetical protein